MENILKRLDEIEKKTECLENSEKTVSTRSNSNQDLEESPLSSPQPHNNATTVGVEGKEEVENNNSPPTNKSKTDFPRWNPHNFEGEFMDSLGHYVVCKNTQNNLHATLQKGTFPVKNFPIRKQRLVSSNNAPTDEVSQQNENSSDVTKTNLSRTVWICGNGYLQKALSSKDEIVWQTKTGKKSTWRRIPPSGTVFFDPPPFLQKTESSNASFVGADKKYVIRGPITYTASGKIVAKDGTEINQNIAVTKTNTTDEEVENNSTKNGSEKNMKNESYSSNSNGTSTAKSGEKKSGEESEDEEVEDIDSVEADELPNTFFDADASGKNKSGKGKGKRYTKRGGERKHRNDASKRDHDLETSDSSKDLSGSSFSGTSFNNLLNEPVELEGNKLGFNSNFAFNMNASEFVPNFGGMVPLQISPSTYVPLGQEIIQQVHEPVVAANVIAKHQIKLKNPKLTTSKNMNISISKSGDELEWTVKENLQKMKKMPKDFAISSPVFSVQNLLDKETKSVTIIEEMQLLFLPTGRKNLEGKYCAVNFMTGNLPVGVGIKFELTYNGNSTGPKVCLGKRFTTEFPPLSDDSTGDDLLKIGLKISEIFSCDDVVEKK